jgi:competence protein ComEC
MRTKAFILFVLLTFWRIGEFIDWHYATLISKFSNDLESTYQEPVDACAHVDAVSRFWELRSVGQVMYCGFKSGSDTFKRKSSDKIQEVLPSPHSELVMGMVLGENRFKLVPTYNDILKTVGLVHVVVVSGYNISLVFTLLMRILGSQYKARNLIVGLFCTFIYSGISGFGVPAVRAWLMGSIAVIFKFYGRPTQGIKVLIFSAIVILCIAPSQLFSVSFQLSFLATLGVMVVPNSLKELWRLLGVRSSAALFEDFNTGLSAQLLVNPVISYYFGTISLVALLANPLVLWVVPLCTILGGVLVFSAFVSPLLTKILALLMYPFLDFFVSFSEFFSKFNSASLQLRFSFYGMLLYYLLVFLSVKLLSGSTRRFKKVDL